MIEIGYHLSSEEHPPGNLVQAAVRAERAGFSFASISDHYHPWTDRQGESAFVWSVLGAIAAATDRLKVCTAVTCPTIRIHPAVIAQAAATTQALFDGRFALGVGTGERLNEHVLGDPWPPPDVRLEMLEEAIAVMRKLWEGDLVTWTGEHYDVERARIYSLPAQPIPVIVAAGGPKAAELAGRAGNGVMATAPERETVDAFRTAGGAGPTYGMFHACVADSKDAALATMREWWPNSAIPGGAGLELAMPSDFEALGEVVPDERLAGSAVLGNDAGAHLDRIKEFADAGYSHVFVHQVGPDQETFVRFYEGEVLPKL